MRDLHVPISTFSAAAIGMMAGLAASAVAGPLIYRGLLALKSRQIVSEYVPEHRAKQGTPTMGGLIVLAGLLAAGLLVPDTPPAWFVLIVGFGLIGFLDDFVVPRVQKGKRGLGWIPKLVMQFAVAIVAGLLTSGEGPVAVGIVAFLVVAYSNAYNLADGMDGLAGGLALVLAVTIGVFGIVMGVPSWHLGLCLGLAAATLPFLMLNAPPAKVFMGDVGALPIGAVIGWLLVRSNGKGVLYPVEMPWLLAALILSLVLIAELVPVPLQILSVKLRQGKRLFPKTPIHHAFEAAGWPETRVAAMFCLTQIIVAAVSLAALWYLLPDWSGE